MNSSVKLNSEMFSTGKIILTPTWIGAGSWALRRTGVSGGQNIKSLEDLNEVLSKSLDDPDDHKDVTIEVVETVDSDVEMYSGLIPERKKYVRTPWYLSDAGVDAVLFVREDGEHQALILRNLVERMDLQEVFGGPIEKLPRGVFFDAQEKDVDPGLVITCCKVELPKNPPLAVWEAGKEQPKKKK